MSSRVAAFHTSISRNLQQQNFQEARRHILKYTSKFPGISRLSHEKQLIAAATIAVCALAALASLIARSVVSHRQKSTVEAFINQSEHIKKLRRIQQNCVIQSSGESLVEGCSLPQRDHERERVALVSLVLFEEDGKDKALCLDEIKKLELQITNLKTLKIAIENLPESIKSKSEMLNSFSNLDKYTFVLAGIKKYLTQEQNEVLRLKVEETITLLEEESISLDAAFKSSLGIELNTLTKLLKSFTSPEAESNESEQLICALLLAAISTKRPLLHSFEIYLNKAIGSLKSIKEMQTTPDLPTSELKILQDKEEALLTAHPLIKELLPITEELEELNLNTLTAALLPKEHCDYLSYTRELLETLNHQSVNQESIRRIKEAFQSMLSEKTSFISHLDKVEIGNVLQHSIETPISYLKPLVLLNLLTEMCAKGVDQYFLDLQEAREFYTLLSTQGKAVADGSFIAPPEDTLEKVLEVLRKSLPPLLETPRYPILADTLVEDLGTALSMEEDSLPQAIIRPIHLVAHGIESFEEYYRGLATLVATVIANPPDRSELNKYLNKLINTYIKLVISNHLKLDNSFISLDFNHLLSDEIVAGRVPSAYNHFSKHLFSLEILEEADRRLSASLPFELELDFS